jgi:hypothetical protein
MEFEPDYAFFVGEQIIVRARWISLEFGRFARCSLVALTQDLFVLLSKLTWIARANRGKNDSLKS